MAKNLYVGNGNIARNVKTIYIGVNGVARKVTKGYIGVGGVARQFWPSIQYKWNRYSIAWGTTSYTAKEVYFGGNRAYGDRRNSPPTITDGLFDVGGMDLSSITTATERVINAARTICCTRTDYSDGYFRLSSGTLSVYRETMTVYTPVETQGELIDTVTASSPDAYPSNGRHTDGYWYVKQ